MDERTKTLAKNRYLDEMDGGEGEDVALADKEASAFRMLAAKLKYMAQDNPYMQLAGQEV